MSGTATSLPPSIEQALVSASARFTDSDSPRLDAELLLASVLACTRTTLRAWPERALPAPAWASFEQLVERRAAGQPTAYLIGWREFWSLDLQVTPATLIPRPGTETLVEAALQRIPEQASWRIADLGTGSGAIALAIAGERPACRVVATDNSPNALKVAEKNARMQGLANLEFHLGDWFKALDGDVFDIIVSNPPYVRDNDPHLEQGDVRFEPRMALTSGEDGLDAIRHIAAHAPAHLKPGGWLMLEHGYDQREAVQALLEEAGYSEIECLRDLGGQPRVCLGRREA